MISSIPEQLRKRAAVPLVALALAAGCEQGGSSSGAQASHRPVPVAVVAAAHPKVQDVAIDNFSFNPPILTVAAGTTVTWVNHDDIPHTVAATDKAFNSGALDTDQRFSHAFTTPGNFTYFCAVHPHMTGQIIVK